MVSQSRTAGKGRISCIKKSGFAPLNLWDSRQGRFVPQLEQKLSVFSALQEGQTQLAAGLAAPLEEHEVERGL